MGLTNLDILAKAKNASKMLRVDYNELDLIILDAGRTSFMANAAAMEGVGRDFRSEKPTVIAIFDGIRRVSIKARHNYTEADLSASALMRAIDILLAVQARYPGKLGFYVMRSPAEADFDVLKLGQEFKRLKPSTASESQDVSVPVASQATQAVDAADDSVPDVPLNDWSQVERIAKDIDEANDARRLVDIDTNQEDEVDEYGVLQATRAKLQGGDVDDQAELPEGLFATDDDPLVQGLSKFIRVRVASNDGDILMHTDGMSVIVEKKDTFGNIFEVKSADFAESLKAELKRRNLNATHASLLAFTAFALLGDYRMITYKGMGNVAFINIISRALDAAQETVEGDVAEAKAGGIHAKRFFEGIIKGFEEAQTEKLLGSTATDAYKEKTSRDVIRHVHFAIKCIAYTCAPLGVCDDILGCMPENIRASLTEQTGIEITTVIGEPVQPHAGVYLSNAPHIVLLRQLLQIYFHRAEIGPQHEVSQEQLMSDWILRSMKITGVPAYASKLDDHPFEPLRRVTRVDIDEFFQLIRNTREVAPADIPLGISRGRTNSDASMSDWSQYPEADLGDRPNQREGLRREAQPLFLPDPSVTDGDLVQGAASVIASNYRQRQDDRRTAWASVTQDRRVQAAAQFSRILKKRIFQDIEHSGADLADKLVLHQPPGASSIVPKETLNPSMLKDLTAVVSRLEMSLTAFDQPSIDLLGASEALLVATEGMTENEKRRARPVFRLLYDIIPKHKKDEHCRAAQHLAQRLWSSEAVREYGLRSSNTARILGMADVMDLDGLYTEYVTTPLTLLSADNGGTATRPSRLPWMYLEQFCRHIASTHIAFENVQYVDARNAMDKVFIDLGYTLEDALDSLRSPPGHRRIIIAAVFGWSALASKPLDLNRTDAKEKRRESAMEYLRKFKPPGGNKTAAQTTDSPRDLLGASSTDFKDWHVMGRQQRAVEVSVLFDHPLFRDNREARVFYGGNPSQQNNSPGLVWLSRMGLRSVMHIPIWRDAVKNVAAVHERIDIRYDELSDAVGRYLRRWEGNSDLHIVRMKIAVAITSAMLKMLEQPADERDLEYCDYLHHRKDSATSNETTRNWQRIPSNFRLPYDEKQQRNARA